MPHDPINDAFAPLRDLPCWEVKRGHGSFITLEFGKPRLVVREPRILRPDMRPKVRELAARRNIHVAGEWHLWIYCCYWNFFQNGEFVGHSHTNKSIDRAAFAMQGQQIVNVEVNTLPGHSVFEFDLGGRLTTRPYRSSDGTPNTQWMLYEPDGNVLSYRGDNCYSHQSGDTKPDEKEWLPVAPSGLKLHAFP